MDALMGIWDFIVLNIFRNPPVLIGLIAVIGLTLQKKKFEDVLKGAVLAALGLFMLIQGTTFISESITSINLTFREVAGVGVPEGLDAGTFIEVYGSETGIAMFIGLILHVLIAKFTPIKTVFLTGHFLWWIPLTFVASGVEGGLSGGSLIALAAITSAIYWSVAPWILRKYVWAVTEDKTWIMGHPTGILSIISGTVARVVGNKEKSTEDVKIPKRLSFLRETPIIGFFAIFTIYLLLNIILGGAISDFTEQPIVPYATNMGLRFGVGLLILLQGVRMLINQIVPAFEGISTRFIKGALPAYDCPLIFPYRPNAVIIGFILAMSISVPLMLVANYFGIFGVMLVPVVITCFFELGTACVIGDGQGGLRGAVIGTAVATVVMVVLLGWSAAFFSTTIQNRMLTVSGNDYSLYGPIVGYFARLLSTLFGGG